MTGNCSETIELLQSISHYLNIYIPLFCLPIGITGNLLNIFIFTRPHLRTNPCTLFLLYSSIANLFHLTFGLVTRIVIDQYQYNIETHSILFCKLKYYIMYISASLSFYFVLFASINRYYQTKSNSRQWCCSQLFHPSKISLVLTLLICLIYIHILILFRIDYSTSSFKSPGLICYAIDSSYRIFIDVFLVITWSLSTPCLMFFFGILTIRNLRFTRTGCQRKQINIQLVLILFFQIIIIFCSTVPFGIQKLVSTFHPAMTICQLEIEAFILCLTRYLSFTNSTFCFFCYVFTEQKFRQELINYFQELILEGWYERRIQQNYHCFSCFRK